MTLDSHTPSFNSVSRTPRTVGNLASRARDGRAASMALAWIVLAGVGILVAVVASFATNDNADPAPATQDAGANRQSATIVSGQTPPDAFYPGFDPKKDRLPPPRKGGRVVVQLTDFPPSLNFMIDNSSVTRRMWQELHASLLRQDLASFEYREQLAREFQVYDQLVDETGDPSSGVGVLVGKIEDSKTAWRIREARGDGTLEEVRELPKRAGQRLLPATVYDFQLRPGVVWHDGVEFDARDVLFSLRCLLNPHVGSAEKRYQFQKIARATSDDPLRLRFALKGPYFLAPNIFESLTILPAHLYDLRDPRNPKAQPDASDEEQARFIDEHPANRQWIGLGPYSVVEWNDRAIVARRFDRFYDAADGGNVDEIVWRHISDDVAITALLDGELDYFDRLSGEDYFGGRTAVPRFDKTHYKGYSYGPQLTYTAWNTRRAKLSDPRVRRALAMCFDWDAFIKGYYKGLAERVTGEQFLRGPAYDPTLAPLPFDVAQARALLAEAGWHDSDADGRVDQGGAPLSIELLYPSGNRTSELSAQAWQANLAKAGVGLTLEHRDWTAFLARVRVRDFDAISMGWITPPVVDPEQAWHSRWAGEGTANHSGLADAQVDRLIETIQVEVDEAKRRELFSQLQRRIYELQPYAFGVNVPRKFAMAKRVRNFECFVIDPGYSIRRWFVVDGN